MGNGATTEFNFNFPYFENSNIIVTKNGATATGYSITGTSAGENADIPYTGGKVVFETAPTALDSITIARSLPLTRIVDYQPLTKINSDTLNKDANYLMEVIKDRKDEIESLIAQYTEIADKESTTTLLARISAIHDEIVAVSAQITALGDISTLHSNVTTNTNDITSLKDASNFTTTGKSRIAALSMPSNHSDVLTFVHAQDYIAPANGYFVMRGYGNPDSPMELQNLTSDIACAVHPFPTSADTTGVFVPAKQGDTVRAYYWNGTVTSFKFVYAE